MKKILTLILIVFAFVFVGNQFVKVDAFSGDKTVTITGIYDGSTALVDTDIYPYGSNVSMDLSGAPAGQTFAFWIVNGIVQPTLAVNNQFVIVNNMNLQVVFTPADKVVAVFMDVNGGYLGSRYVTSGGAADTSAIALPYRPGFESVDGAGRWTKVYGSDSVTNITQNSVFVQNYVDDATTNTVNIVVNNGTGTAVKNFNSIVTAVANPAPEGQKFSHWEENGVMISTKETYLFTALYDREITAVYVADSYYLLYEFIVTLSNDVEKRPGYHTYVAQLDIPVGFEVIEYGLLIGDNADVLDETHYSHIVQGTNIHPLTNEFISSMSIGSHMSVRAFVVVEDEGSLITYYSEVNHRYIEEISYVADFEAKINNSYVRSGTTNLDVAGGILWKVTTTATTNTGILWNYLGTQDANITPDQGSNIARIDGRSGQSTTIETNDYQTFIGKLHFDAKFYGTVTASVLKVFYQVDNSSETWIELPQPTLTSSFELYEYNINKNNVKIRFVVSGERVNIDNITFVTLYKGSVVDVVYNELNGTINNTIRPVNYLANYYEPNRTGYTFDGWYNTPEYSGDSFDFNIALSTDVQLYAKWLINQYTISFNSNDGTPVSAITQNYDTAVVAPSNPTKMGYTFAGWYSDAGLTTPYTFTTIPADNITLYAKWNISQYTISFEENGGSAVADITQNFATVVSQPSDPTKDGYTFAGWFTEVPFENEYIFTTMPAQNITIYAKWIENSSLVTVSFNSNGGSSVESIILVSGEYAVKPTNPTKTGYSFVKWETIGSVEWLFESMPVTEDITLYAVWNIQQFTITFNSNGGSSVTAITQDYGTIVVEPADPTRDGYTFDAWYSNEGLTNAYTFTTMPAQNINLYAKWISNAPQIYTITITRIDNVQDSTSYLDGANVNSKLAFSNNGDATITVTYNRNSASTHSIFNNTSNEIRLYPGTTNGGQLTYLISAGYKIVSITVNTSQNPGLSLTNNVGPLTTASTLQEYNPGVLSVWIKNAVNASSGTANQLRITNVVITYQSE